MTKPIFLSLHPRFAQAILDGSKTQELRRRFPTQTEGTEIFVYATSPVKKLVGSFTIETVEKVPVWKLARTRRKAMNLAPSEIRTYLAGLTHGTVIAVRAPVKFRVPVDLESLRALGVEPPQSYRFIPPDALSDLRALVSEDVAESRLSPVPNIAGGFIEHSTRAVLPAPAAEYLQLVG